MKQFTRNVDALAAAVPAVLSSADHNDTLDVDALLADATRYFGAQRDMVGQNVLHCDVDEC